jgi:hypothetical protein
LADYGEMDGDVQAREWQVDTFVGLLICLKRWRGDVRSRMERGRLRNPVL